MAEQGRVVVRVELDERGNVTRADIASSSGAPRLDDAALAAIRQWRCNPALRGGVPVRAVALQPFNFILEGR
jgi:protein TonB